MGSCAQPLRNIIRTTNAINARLRRAVNACGPSHQAVLKCLYLAVMSLDPTGKGRKRWSNRWEGSTQRLRHDLRQP